MLLKPNLIGCNSQKQAGVFFKFIFMFANLNLTPCL